MINKDSIVTAYDEHLTLVEWLQKVEKALDNAVLTNLGIAKLSEQGNVATYQVTATFADNTTIVSNTFTLPSTDIVTAFNDLTALVNGFDDRITDNTNDVASIIDIIDIGNNKIKASTLQNSINGSDEVIVDIDNTNDKLEIHLSPELQAKLARVLLKPSSAPTTRKVVTIDTNGAQDNVDETELNTLISKIINNSNEQLFAYENGVVKCLKPLEDTPITIDYEINNHDFSYEYLYAKATVCDHKMHIVISGQITKTASTTQNQYFIFFNCFNYRNKIFAMSGNTLENNTYEPSTSNIDSIIRLVPTCVDNSVKVYRLIGGYNRYIYLYVDLNDFALNTPRLISIDVTLEV